MTSTLCSTDRYLLLRGSVLLFTTNHLDDITTYLWAYGFVSHDYVVMDYETPSPVTHPDLAAFLAPLRAAATADVRRA
jgi:hypothetical protein